MYNVKSNYKGTEVVISISDSEDFRTRNIAKDKDRAIIMVKSLTIKKT